MKKLQDQVWLALAGERLASCLPIVHEPGEEYDAHAIATDALQIAYDQTRPPWMQSDSSNMEQERPAASKPILIKRSQTFASRRQIKSTDYSIQEALFTALDFAASFLWASQNI